MSWSWVTDGLEGKCEECGKRLRAESGAGVVLWQGCKFHTGCLITRFVREHDERQRTSYLGMLGLAGG